MTIRAEYLKSGFEWKVKGVRPLRSASGDVYPAAIGNSKVHLEVSPSPAIRTDRIKEVICECAAEFIIYAAEAIRPLARDGWYS